MKAKKWNLGKDNFIDIEVDDRCSCYTENMDQKVVCPGCGKEFKFGTGYCSLEYYNEDGIWGIAVCEDCFLKEREAQRNYEQQE